MNAAVTVYSNQQVDLIRRTVAKSCEQPDEFELFMNIAKLRGLCPLKRQIYAFVQVDKPKKGSAEKPKRQLVPIISIDGQRSLAARTKNYKADDRVPRVVYDNSQKNPDTNPIGLVSAEVGVFAYVHGEWHYHPAIAYWDEFAPIVEDWVEDANGKFKPSGKSRIDPRKKLWRTSPRVMLPKCAEMQALRAAFPDEYGGLYGEAEMDRTESQQTFTEIVEAAGRERRMVAIGGSKAIIDWLEPGGELQPVAFGELPAKIEQFAAENAQEPGTIIAFRERNRHALRELWAHNKSDALELNKKIFEPAEKALEARTAAE